MSFIWPLMLLSLVLIPLCVLLYVRMQQRKRRLAVRYGSLGFVQTGAGQTLGVRRHFPPLLFLAGLTLLLIAMARPQAVVTIPRLAGTVLLTFDVSGSMAADDLKPTRMEAAKAAAVAFVQRQPSTVQIGIVAFSESGMAVLPPTNDQETILAAINRLKPERGTSLAQGIFASLNVLFPPEQTEEAYTNLTPTPTVEPTAAPKGSLRGVAIVLLTDGENTAPPEPFEAAQVAADRGVRIYTVGVGSASGVTLEVEGFTVHTQLDEATLQQIAAMTAGAYFNAENETELRTIYENLAPQLVVKADEMEITSLFAGASMLILLLGSTFSLLWFNRLP